MRSKVNVENICFGSSTVLEFWILYKLRDVIVVFAIASHDKKDSFESSIISVLIFWILYSFLRFDNNF